MAQEQKIIKTSVSLPEDTLNTLKEIAGNLGVPMVDVLKQSISTEKYLQDTARQGGKILIKEQGNDTLKELVIRR